MAPWDTSPNLPADDRRLNALRKLGDKRRASLAAADETLAAIEPLIRELVAADEKKRVISDLGCVSRTHIDRVLDGG